MLVQLLEAGLLHQGERLYWPRASTGKLHKATITADGHVRLADGTRHATPSAALTALGSPNSSGWKLWRLARDDQPLDTVRRQYRTAGTAPAAAHP